MSAYAKNCHSIVKIFQVSADEGMAKKSKSIQFLTQKLF